MVQFGVESGKPFEDFRKIIKFLLPLSHLRDHGHNNSEPSAQKRRAISILITYKNKRLFWGKAWPTMIR